MEKEFVTYEIALKLKELGFDEPCIMFYDVIHNNDLRIGTEDSYWGDYTGFRKWNSMPNSPWKPFGLLISAPLWQQAIDWLREEHNIYIDISGRLIDSEDKTFQWNVYGLFVEIPGELYSGLDKDFNMARIQSTERAIELVK